MAYPQGYLYQPSASLALYSCPAYSTSVISGPRTEELGRSSSGSAFAPYTGSTAFTSPSPGFSSPLQYSTDPTASTFTSYVGSPYEHATGMPGSLGYHPYAAPLGSYPYGDPAYRKNATRDATATLKAWLNEHRKNPYPTKGEKIMLAIITKMTLTQVSTWFANARRRLKKENKMTWTPRNRSEDEEEDENIDLEKNDDEEPHKANGKGDLTDTETENKLNQGEVTCDRFNEESRGKQMNPVLTESELKQQDDRTELLAKSPKPTTSSPNLSRGASITVQEKSTEMVHVSSTLNGGSNVTSVIHSPPSAPKPKLWSLAEIATSSDRCKGNSESPQTPGPGQSTVVTVNDSSPSRSSPHCPFPNSTVLSRPIYYTSPFYPGYTNYGTFGHLHSNHGASTGSTAQFNGLNQTVLNRADALVRESKIRSHTQVDFCKDSNYELKKAFPDSQQKCYATSLPDGLQWRF